MVNSFILKVSALEIPCIIFFLASIYFEELVFQAIHHVRVLNCPALDWNEKHIQVFNEIFFFCLKRVRINRRKIPK